MTREDFELLVHEYGDAVERRHDEMRIDPTSDEAGVAAQSEFWARRTLLRAFDALSNRLADALAAPAEAP
jgi:hypothetical protein